MPSNEDDENTTDKLLLEQLLKIIAINTGIEKSSLKLDSVLAELGCDGVTAMELLDVIEEEFEVDFSQFEYHRYFNDEGLINSIREPLTVQDILAAVKAKAWIPLETREIKRTTFSEWPLMILLIFFVVAILAPLILRK